jgi:DnaJ-domain-containing protein 1
MDLDAFDELGLDPAFDLADAAIQRAYLARSARLHPDLAGDEADFQALAHLNDARAALLDPERRAGVLLARLGGPSKESNRSLPEGFLPRVMEVQEAIEEARSAGDDLDTWRTWAESERAEIIADVAPRFAAAQADPAPERLADIRTRLNAWRYIERIIEQLDA